MMFLTGTAQGRQASGPYRPPPPLQSWQKPQRGLPAGGRGGARRTRGSSQRFERIVDPEARGSRRRPSCLCGPAGLGGNTGRHPPHTLSTATQTSAAEQWGPEPRRQAAWELGAGQRGLPSSHVPGGRALGPPLPPRPSHAHRAMPGAADAGREGEDRQKQGDAGAAAQQHPPGGPRLGSGEEGAQPSPLPAARGCGWGGHVLKQTHSWTAGGTSAPLPLTSAAGTSGGGGTHRDLLWAPVTPASPVVRVPGEIPSWATHCLRGPSDSLAL